MTKAITDSALSNAAMKQLFLEARTHRVWKDTPVSEDMLHAVYNLMKWGPTSANSCPARLVFVVSAEAKEKLIACLSPGNVKKVQSAPATVIVAEDLEFYEQLSRLSPRGDARSMFLGKKELIESTAFRNSSIQGGYLILAARALGLDCGPMSGFDNAKVDAAFFAGTAWRSNFLCNIGHGDSSALHPREPRLDFSDACRIV
jgi:3-hydroxypropanoate dehydrogenase